ncbi:MAG: AAA family ATPase [Clostridiales bacterium]|nr:AAA family ATPase [Clostridiales bacterium]
MGEYLNPGNDGFETIRNGIYVDKTGLIDYINSTIYTPLKLTSFSRPRRFEKSFAAKMLCAYYDRSCDSRSLFEGLEISKKATFEKNLNQYDVIYLDITWFISTTNDVKNVVTDIQDSVISELKHEFPAYVSPEERSLSRVLSGIAVKTGNKTLAFECPQPCMLCGRKNGKQEKSLARRHKRWKNGQICLLRDTVDV